MESDRDGSKTTWRSDKVQTWSVEGCSIKGVRKDNTPDGFRFGGLIQTVYVEE